MGVIIEDERSRIFKVEKMPVQRNALPPVMQGTKIYRFYEPTPSDPNRLRELRPFLGDEYSRRYFEQMDELAKDIAALLAGMAKWQPTGHVQKPDRSSVYVAETTSDLDDRVGELRRDLKDRGYLVVPVGDLPYRARAYKDASAIPLSRQFSPFILSALNTVLFPKARPNRMSGCSTNLQWSGATIGNFSG